MPLHAASGRRERYKLPTRSSPLLLRTSLIIVIISPIPSPADDVARIPKVHVSLSRHRKGCCTVPTDTQRAEIESNL